MKFFMLTILAYTITIKNVAVMKTANENIVVTVVTILLP